ncbi:MAG: signal peptidase II, partial [Pseudomonadales bacterium]|nr:signal peptidase II [Pseudomonadales bacterium]
GGISALVSVVLVIWIARLDRAKNLLAAALTLVLAGALGNLYDRVFYGYVVDFVDIYYRQWHWPAFNLADSVICLGAALLLLDAFLDRPLNEDEPR